MDIKSYLKMRNEAQNKLSKGLSYGFASAVLWEITEKSVNEIGLDKILEISKKIIEIEPYNLSDKEKEQLLSILNEFDKVIGSRVALLSADTDKVKSYVFESPRLPEMRGASLILEELNNRDLIKNILEEYKLPEDCIIYSSGGSILMFIPESLQTEIKKHIEKQYLEKTATAMITVVSQVFTYSQFCFGLNVSAKNPIGFGELVDFLAYELKKAKQEKKYVPFFETIPFAYHCESCGIRPVSYKIDGKHFCHSCYTKRTEGKKGRSYLIKKFQESSDEYVKQFGKCYAPDDLNDIGEISDGYIGLIYADGNNVGRSISQLHTCKKYKQFTEDMLEATSSKVCYEFARNKLVSKDCKLVAELLCGLESDDVIAIVPGKYALQLAINICKAFTESMSPYNIKMSAGVLIAPHNYPVYYLEEVCKQLLKSAKKGFRNVESESTIDFWVITSQDVIVSDLKDYRKQFMEKILNERNPRSDRLAFYERPYTIDKLQCLLNWIREFHKRNFPKNQLYGLRESLEEGRMQASLYYLYQRSRMSKENRELMDRFISDLNLNNGDLFPWRKTEKPSLYTVYSTPIVDLLEIYDFAEEV